MVAAMNEGRSYECSYSYDIITCDGEVYVMCDVACCFGFVLFVFVCFDR